MKLNRDNYEEYFILYLDNELDAESRQEVEAFAKQNPDLKAELDLLMQSRLIPEPDISFTDKGSLMRFDSSSISLANYEEWLTSYIDDELTDGERRDVEVFVAGNPAIQRELNLLQQTKLQPEAIVFPYKESLYRKEEKARVIFLRWRRIAAAAVLLLAISTTTIVLVNNKKGNGGGDVATGNKATEPVNIDTTVKQPVIERINEKAPLAVDKKKEGTKEPRNTIAVKQKNSKSEENKEQREPVKKNEEVAVVPTKEKQPSKDIAQPINIPSVNKDVQSGNAIVDASRPTLTNNEGKTKSTDVTSPPSNTYNNTDGSGEQIKNSEIAYASENSGGSNKGIRGFLRKVTRTLEKRTNIKATDDDDRLLVAGLAIKL